MGFCRESSVALDKMYVSLRLRVVLSARDLDLNGQIKVKDETTLRVAVGADLLTGIPGKPKRQILSQIFRSSRFFRPPKHRDVE